MSSVELLRTGFGLAHQLFHFTIDDLPPEVAAKQLPGASIGSALPILAHAVFVEDLLVSQAVSGGETLLVSGGWTERTGIPGPHRSQDAEWAKAAFDLEGLKAYTNAVFERTEQFLAGATDADLARQVRSPFGNNETAVGNLLVSLGLAHLSAHGGEIAALKGVQGVKGLPF